jgi:hypothetical protein
MVYCSGGCCASLAGRSPAIRVLAMCGVAAPLRHLDLMTPAAALSRLDDIECPIEGISCLQVRIMYTSAALLKCIAGHC